jgi:hypothetical protein
LCVDCKGSQICKTPLCSTRSSKKYDKYCFRCYIYLNPDKPVSRNYKTKELTVVDFIKEIFPQYDWVNDKKIQDGCSRRRPDLLVDFGDKIIILEIDENKHLNYNIECETKRLNDISLDLNCRPIVLIRFNPDGYTTEGVKIPSCWGIHRTSNILIIKNKKEWNKRLQVLVDTINYFITDNSSEPITIKELFY